MFAMGAEDFRKEVYKEFTRVHEVKIAGIPAITAFCPHCDKPIIIHRVESTEIENAEAILVACEHKRTCPPWRKT